ncbi:MAG TPA: hypothetical protein VLL98_04315, partial [Rickettsiales bacterium]|nr:hypothetical protein [Rickettsiales bacterium]
EEMYLSDLEFKILNLAVQHNQGMINLLSNVDTIYGLFQKGLVTITKDKLSVVCVSDLISFILNPKIREDFPDDYLEEENRPNSICKHFGNLTVSFYCL